jgi:hypothetical protein
MFFQRNDGIGLLLAGSNVRIRQSHRTPYSGREGIIESIDETDSKGAYLVRFEDGTQFRYNAHEIESAQSPRREDYLIERL